MGQCVSVIVPIYNIGAYLEKCIRSITAQTYQNLQIILVDDGSTDDSSGICDRYRIKDSRITVIHKQNGGLVSARKAGIQAAEGGYVAWVDGDDWIEPTYIEELVHALQATGADMVAANLFFDIGPDSKVVKNHFAEGLYKPSQLAPRLLYAGEFFTYGIQPHIYTKLIRRELLISVLLKVDERIAAGEDAAVIYPCILSADKIYVSDICGYHYVQRPGTMTKMNCPDELTRDKVLLKYLWDAFREYGAAELFRGQMVQYAKYMFILRQLSVFDDEKGAMILTPYGGIKRDSRVLLYGAGGVGQKICHYLHALGTVKLVDWLDQNYEEYRKYGCRVNAPGCVKDWEGQYDCIIIANINGNAAESIRDYLEDEGVEKHKILWFSEEFLDRNMSDGITEG